MSANVGLIYRCLQFVNAQRCENFTYSLTAPPEIQLSPLLISPSQTAALPLVHLALPYLLQVLQAVPAIAPLCQDHRPNPSRAGPRSPSMPDVAQPVVTSEDEFELVMGLFEKATHEKTEFLHLVS